MPQFTDIIAAITKNGMQRLTQPAELDLEKYKSDKKIEDEEILKILEQPIGKSSVKKNKKKKKKPAKKAAAGGSGKHQKNSVMLFKSRTLSL
jgi:hypothetical protein